MNCKNAAKLFSEQIEGSLDAQRSERLLAHLDRCPDCAELVEIMELNMVQLENAPEPGMPAGLEQRLAGIPRHERAAAGAQGYAVDTPRRAGGHWLFSNAAAAVILAMFITANLTWFNPDFKDSIRGCQRLINDQSARALELASDWGEDLNDMKQKVESRMDVVRDTDEENRSAILVTELIRALGLIGA